MPPPEIKGDPAGLSPSPLWGGVGEGRPAVRRKPLPALRATLPTRGRERPHTRSIIVAVPMPAPMHSVTQRGLQATALQFVEHGAEDHRAGGAERMAHGNRAAIDVDLVMADVEGLHVAEHDGGKGLVEFRTGRYRQYSCRRASRAFR